MTTVRYARYVLVNEAKGMVAWYENPATAEKAKNINGGEIFDTDNTDPEDLAIILHHARKNMGDVEE